MNTVAASPPAPAVREPMDREFIDRNQIVERYLLGKLPPRGVADFEREVRENPALIDQTGLAERVHRAVAHGSAMLHQARAVAQGSLQQRNPVE